MVSEDTMNGRCWECEFFKENRCLKAERSLSTTTNPVCLMKMMVIAMRSIVEELHYQTELLEEEE